MERLTKIIEGVTVYVGPGNEFDNGLMPDELLDDQIRTVMRRLAAYENTGLAPEQIQEAVDLLNDSFYDADIPKELLSWVERCTWHVRKCNELHAELEKYRALGSVEELTEMKFRLEGLEK